MGRYVLGFNIKFISQMKVLRIQFMLRGLGTLEVVWYITDKKYKNDTVVKDLPLLYVHLIFKECVCY